MSELVERFFTHDLSGDAYSLFKWAEFDARIENYFTTRGKISQWSSFDSGRCFI